MIFLFWDVCLALTWIFLICELGHIVHNAFEEITYRIENFDWYLLPYELKQIFPICIVFVRQSVDFDVFGSISCSRVDFKNVRELFFSTIVQKSQINL